MWAFVLLPWVHGFQAESRTLLSRGVAIHAVKSSSSLWDVVAESVPRVLQEISLTVSERSGDLPAAPSPPQPAENVSSSSQSTPPPLPPPDEEQPTRWKRLRRRGSALGAFAKQSLLRRGERRRPRERRSYLVDAERVDRSPADIAPSSSSGTTEEDVSAESAEQAYASFERVSPLTIEHMARSIESLRDNGLATTKSDSQRHVVLGPRRSGELDSLMSVEEYATGDDGGAVVPVLFDDPTPVMGLPSQETAAQSSRDAAAATGLERRVVSGLSQASKIARTLKKEPDYYFNFAAHAALCARSRKELGRFCRDEQLPAVLVEKLVLGSVAECSAKTTVAAANALAHLVALDSATSRAPLVRGGSAGSSQDPVSGDGDVARWLVEQPALVDAVVRLLGDDMGIPRRAALRLALRLASHTGNGGDDAVSTLRSKRRVRRYLRRTMRLANDPERARRRVAGARAACANAVRVFAAREKQQQNGRSSPAHAIDITLPSSIENANDDSPIATMAPSNVSSAPPPPTPSAAYWRRKRGMFSPPFAQDAYEKELRDATKLNAALGLRTLSRAIDTPSVWRGPSPEAAASDGNLYRRGTAAIRRSLKRRRPGPRRRGVRVLCLDGGGTRGVITIELLRQLQRRCFGGLEPHECFDLIVGTSTGAILAVLLGAKQCALADAAGMYDRLVSRIFVKKSVQGSTMLVLRRAFYDERDIENVFDELLGDDDFLDSAEQPRTPAIACLATLLAVSPSKVCLLRNYEYPKPKKNPFFLSGRLFGPRPHATSRYPGSCRLPMRDALRAATAAPTLFTPVALRGQLLCDGALISNNPSSVGMHEAAALFPGVPIEAVVSVGTGEMEPAPIARTSLNWDGIINQLIDSATSTSIVHDVLTDLAPPNKYYRFNPGIHTSPIDATDEALLADFRNAAATYFDDPVTSKRAACLADTLRIKPARGS